MNKDVGLQGINHLVSRDLTESYRASQMSICQYSGEGHTELQAGGKVC